MSKTSSHLWAILAIAANTLWLNAAQAQENYAGDWEGPLTVAPNVTVTLQFNIKADNQDLYSALLYSPDEGAQLDGIPSASAAVEGNTITLAFPNIGAEYQGTLKNGVIEGEWRQAGQIYPLSLSASEDPE